MSDTFGKQPVRTSDSGDVEVGVLDTSNNRIDPRSIRSLTNSDVVSVEQSSASALNATVVQSTASNLNATVVQSTASNLNATVVQSTASNLKSEVSQPTASALHATITGGGSAGSPDAGVVSVQGVSGGTAVTVSQSTASNLNATVVQSTASNLNATVVQSTAANLNATVVQSTASNLKTAISDSSGAAFSSTNGLYVLPTTAAVWNVNITGGSTTIADYDGSVAAGNGGPAVTHEYVNSTGFTIRINSVVIGSSTSSSYYVFIDPTGGGYNANPSWVGFVSEATPSFIIDTAEFHLANGGKIKVVKTNTAKLATSYSVHSTINADY